MEEPVLGITANILCRCIPFFSVQYSPSTVGPIFVTNSLQQVWPAAVISLRALALRTQCTAALGCIHTLTRAQHRRQCLGTRLCFVPGFLFLFWLIVGKVSRWQVAVRCITWDHPTFIWLYTCRGSKHKPQISLKLQVIIQCLTQDLNMIAGLHELTVADFIRPCPLWFDWV